MVDLEQKERNAALDREALSLKRRQERVLKRFNRLENSDDRHFQSDFVMLQAKEICSYLKDMSIAPIKAWHDHLKVTVADTSFMWNFYLTYNEFEEIVPDEKRIKELILPEPMKEEEIRTSGTMDFE